MASAARKRINTDMVNPYDIKDIVDNGNFQHHFGLTRAVSDPADSFPGITENQIPVDLSGLPCGRFVTGQPGASVPEHTHEGPLFRYIIEGEAIVNGKTYRAGDWMVIPSRKPYSIESPKGYRAFWNCAVCG